VINLLRAPETIQGSFPQCAAAGINPANIYVAVHASTHDPPLYVASAARAAQGLLPHYIIMNCKKIIFNVGMALWIAILIHIIGVEFYVRSNKFDPHPADNTACRSSKQTLLTKSGSISRWNPVISLRTDIRTPICSPCIRNNPLAVVPWLIT
jgi:hypothetical protein